ncbi:MAG: hypothetical protein MJZ81_07500 [Bacteroidales bacterium]|nr:hypothetical protein [Bacteroidales bacterium]
MASKVYSAQDMRDAANSREAWGYKDALNNMLRQAAEALEREKKYEYSVLYCVDESEFNDVRHFDTLDDAKDNVDDCGYDELKFVRREVGEWEEVK